MSLAHRAFAAHIEPSERRTRYRTPRPSLIKKSGDGRALPQPQEEDEERLLLPPTPPAAGPSSNDEFHHNLLGLSMNRPRASHAAITPGLTSGAESGVPTAPKSKHRRIDSIGGAIQVKDLPLLPVPELRPRAVSRTPSPIDLDKALPSPALTPSPHPSPSPRTRQPTTTTTTTVRAPYFNPNKGPAYQWCSALASTSRCLQPWGWQKRWTCCSCAHLDPFGEGCAGRTIVEQKVCARLECGHRRCPRCELEWDVDITGFSLGEIGLRWG